MSETESKESTIKKVYENAASGYGSVRDTYQQANKINPGIRYVDVKEYLDKQQHRQTRFKYKGSTSFVSPHALFEIEADLIDRIEAFEDFGLRYDIDSETWKVITSTNLSTSAVFDLNNAGSTAGTITDPSWWFTVDKK